MGERNTISNFFHKRALVTEERVEGYCIRLSKVKTAQLPATNCGIIYQTVYCTVCTCSEGALYSNMHSLYIEQWCIVSSVL